MKVQIDQSVKIEQTNRNTILAFANHIDYAVVILAKDKQRMQAIFRRQGQPKLFIYQTFAAGITLLIKNYINKIDVAVIDREYPSRERLIKRIIEEMLKKLSCRQPQIYFREISRRSPAHNVAYSILKRKRKADKVLSFKELEKLIFK